MTIIIALIFQHFDLVVDDPSYELQLKQTLTIKPKDYHIRAIPRKGGSVPIALSSSSLHKARLGDQPQPTQPASVAGSELRQQLYVLYGSNTGTSETFAQRVTSDAATHGMSNGSYRKRFLLTNSRLSCRDGNPRLGRRQASY